MTSHIALLMMVKNESKRILTTLNSVKDTVKSLVIYDTGSDDNTLELIEVFSKINSIPVHIKKGEFVDFSVSRNVALDFGEEFKEIDYFLLMDGNDELKNGDLLQNLADKLLKDDNHSGFLVCQEWLDISGSITKYFNVRFIKARHGWRFKGAVHEYISSPNKEPSKIDDKIVIFQDRKYDSEKSMSRYAKDKVFLLKDLKENPTDPRTLFYLGQTCGCLKEFEEACEYYKRRAELANGFYEERFHSYLRLGELSMILRKDWNISLEAFLNAYNVIPRAEPLVKIAEYYRNKSQWNLAYMFVSEAVKLEYPSNCTLFVDRRLYNYYRWHLLGIVAYYAGKYKEGKIGCLKAIETGPNLEIDKSNLKFYTDKLDSKK
jgi:glycosyltransferase involved in cell wall biosynthesis